MMDWHLESEAWHGEWRPCLRASSSRPARPCRATDSGGGPTRERPRCRRGMRPRDWPSAGVAGIRPDRIAAETYQGLAQNAQSPIRPSRAYAGASTEPLMGRQRWEFARRLVGRRYGDPVAGLGLPPVPLGPSASVHDQQIPTCSWVLTAPLSTLLNKDTLCRPNIIPSESMPPGFSSFADSRARERLLKQKSKLCAN